MPLHGSGGLRLAALGLSHESNTFAPSRVDLRAFTQHGILRGDQIRRRHVTAKDTMAGFLAARTDAEIVPLIFAKATPAGPITRDAFDLLVSEMTTLLSERGPFHGVLMVLHGAAVAEHVPDADGHILRRVRHTVGPGVPIGVALDLHANISKDMADHCDVLSGYRTNPHVDARDRAIEVADLIIRTARGEIGPTLALEQLPAAINILCQNTDTDPMRSILDDLDELLGAPGVLTATAAEGYPYADVPEMGMSVVVVTDGDSPAARAHAIDLGKKVWARRDQFVGRAASMDDALRRAAASWNGPVLLLDVGDNVGAGSPGNSVAILDEARRLGIGGLLATITDPTAAAACAAAGTGAPVRLRAGAVPVEIQGVVRMLHDGRYQDSGPTHSGQRHFDAGPTAVVDTDDGNVLVFTTNVVGAYSSAHLPVLALDPRDFRIIVAKGVHSPLASYGPLATDIIQVDTPGVTSADLNRFTYTRRRRPLFPFEPDATYPHLRTGKEDHRR